MLQPESQHYLAEIQRVLRNGGSSIVTAFLLEDGGAIPQFPHQPEMAFPFGGPSVWWRVRSHPEAAVAYEQSRFIELVEAAGLAVKKIIRGHWSGCGVAPNFQDIVIVSSLPG